MFILSVVSVIAFGISDTKLLPSLIKPRLRQKPIINTILENKKNDKLIYNNVKLCLSKVPL